MGAAGGVERFEDLHDLPVRLLQGPSVDSARLWSKTSSEAPEGPLVSDRHDRPTTPAEKGDQLSAERELTCPPTGILGCPRSLACVTDVFSRLILGLSMASHRKTVAVVCHSAAICPQG